MGIRISPKLLSTGIVAWAALLCTGLVSAETDSPAMPAMQSTDEKELWVTLALQSIQQLQERQQATLRALEQARQDAAATARAIELARQETESATKRNAEAVDARLNRIEQAVATQREREIETMQSSHRLTLVIVGAFAGVGFVGMLLFALFLLRAMNRRMEMAGVQPGGLPIGAGYAAAALGTGETHLAPLNPVEQSSARVLSAVERLEQRIREMEAITETARVSTEVSAPTDATKAAAEPPAAAAEAVPTRRAGGETESRIALLLGKGQALLNLQQADNALACFDEVTRLDPTNAEAFVRRGSALERAGRLDEAIESYDQAIALDNSITLAYLCKGGVFNRLERYGEALQCYEQALRAQQKTGVA
jgi:tetratricopeptide (TPR) repeat protein